MELKKSVKADLEWRKPTFFQVGLVVTLLVVFLTFELVGSGEKKIKDIFRGDTEFFDDDHVINVVHPPDLPPPPEPNTAMAIEIVMSTNPNDERELFNTEIDENALAPMQTYTVPIEAPEPEIVLEDPIFRVVEEDPAFPGGEAARIRFLNENIRYPRSAQEIGVEGRVLVGFVVESDGSISNIKILRSAAPILDEEAIRVAKLMPKWKPGKQRGKAVRVQYQMPITFTLYN